MTLWGRAVQHMDLMSQMFARTGAADGALAFVTEANLKQAIIRCQTCGAQEACGNYLRNAADGDDAPDFCNNKALIERLREPGHSVL